MDIVLANFQSLAKFRENLSREVKRSKLPPSTLKGKLQVYTPWN